MNIRIRKPLPVRRSRTWAVLGAYSLVAFPLVWAAMWALNPVVSPLVFALPLLGLGLGAVGLAQHLWRYTDRHLGFGVGLVPLCWLSGAAFVPFGIPIVVAVGMVAIVLWGTHSSAVLVRVAGDLESSGRRIGSTS